MSYADSVGHSTGTSDSRAGKWDDAKGVAAACLIFLYWTTFENRMFFSPEEYGGPILVLLSNLLKLGVPVVVLLLVGLPSARMVTRGANGVYVFFFGIFLLWTCVPTLIYGDMTYWLRMIPRFVFFMALMAFFERCPWGFRLLAKCIVCYATFALVQYVLLYMTGPYIPGSGGFVGPLGLLGNIDSAMTFPGLDMPWYRLSGFWNEPSNASAVAFEAFFLARYLVVMGESRAWHRVSLLCLTAGFLAFSLAGDLAFAAALLVGMTLGEDHGSSRVRIFAKFILGLAVVVALIAIVFGRNYVAENFPDNNLARALTGVRSEGVVDDPTAGREALLNRTLKLIADNPFGSGLQAIGAGGVESSASAPIMWLFFAGIPGLLFLLFREGALAWRGLQLVRSSPSVLPLLQAMTVIVVQHTSYGDWMNANYLVLAAAILVGRLPRTAVRRTIVSQGNGTDSYATMHAKS